MTADLSNLVVEILHKRDDDNHPYWSVGSGFFVSSRRYATAKWSGARRQWWSGAGQLDSPTSRC